MCKNSNLCYNNSIQIAKQLFDKPNIYQLLMQKQQPEDSIILHFNDAYDIEPDHHGNMGFLNFYDYVLNLQKTYNKPLLVFSGDAFAPSKLSRLFRGEQMAHCLKMLGVTIACYGNHDFDFQPKHCLNLAKQCGFPWLMGNVKYLDTGKNIGEGLDYYIMNHGGVKIGFLGLGGPDFIGRLISDYTDKLKYHQITEYAKKMCAVLKSQNCQLIIAVTHCRRPADEKLAEEVPQIDLILGGHDHVTLCKMINKIPIVKSGSDFQFLSNVKYKKINLQRKDNKDSLQGRRWTFDIVCQPIKKTKNRHADLEEYIKSAVKALKDHETGNPSAMKPKNNLQRYEHNEWLLHYHFINNRAAVSLNAGLSAQICFAKYVAFKKNLVFVGYKKAVPNISYNFVEESLNFIYSQVLSHSNLGKTVLYSPGICSVPYLVQTGNLIYLPSQFLVGVNSLQSLSTILQVAHKKGHRCYAVMGYDPFIHDKLCAWIKFTHPPLQYLRLVKELQIDNIIFMTVHGPKGERQDSNQTARIIRGRNLQIIRQSPQPQDIYLVFVQQTYKNSIQKDINIFKKLINDVSEAQWKQISERPLCKFIHDWQNAIESITELEFRWNSELSIKNINFHYIISTNTFALYLCAYYLGKQFIALNSKQGHPNGVVFNHSFMSNPTYELNYGCIPILYQESYPKNQQRLTSVLTEDQLKLKRWFNLHQGQNFAMIQPDSKVIASNHEGLKLAQHIAKYSRKQYKLNYLNLKQILSVLSQNKLLVKTKKSQLSQQTIELI